MPLKMIRGSFCPTGDKVIRTATTAVLAFGCLLTSLGSGQELTTISAIQGQGYTSPLKDKRVRIRGVITGEFLGRDRLQGFFLQEIPGDGNPKTSDGIFVAAADSVRVREGDFVEVAGTVAEKGGLTCVVGTETFALRIRLLRQDVRIEPTEVTLPLDSVRDLENLEGMLLTFPQTLTVTDVYNLGRFGEVMLSAPKRLYIPTTRIDPNDEPASGTNSAGTGNVSAVTAQSKLNSRSWIVMDDGSMRVGPATVPYVNRNPGAPRTLRVGSTVRRLKGALSYAAGRYRLHPTTEPVIQYAPRPSLPNVRSEANLTVAAFNVWNYFATIDDGSNDARGADSQREQQRQRSKILAALAALDADVVCLVELERHGPAIDDIVKGLNEVLGAGRYAAISDPADLADVPGDEAVKVGVIYKPAVVGPVGDPHTIRDPAFRNARAPVAQTFRLGSNNADFTVIVNHFKSKRAYGATGADEDQEDGQGAYNDSRRRQAAALLRLVKTAQSESRDDDVLIMGDLNSDAQEDPIDLLREGGFVDELQRHCDEQPYTYVYFGKAGCLDHALSSPSLSPQIVAAAVWHINADEPTALDYNDDRSDSSTRTDQLHADSTLYQPDPYRSSDHDPIIIGLDLRSANNF